MDQDLDFRKLTGPIEHWLTTLHQGYWGFRSDKKNAWEEIREDEVFVFHASKSKFLNAPRGALTGLDTGIIGIGRVGAKSRKSDPVWWEEIHLDGNYPYLIHFSEIYWFGDVEKIRDAPVADKDIEEMVEDVHTLAENIITFKEMKNRTGYQIPPQGSPANIGSPEKLFPLLSERIEGQFDTPTPETEEPVSEIRERSRDRNLDPTRVENQEITYEPAIRDTIMGTIDHERILDLFEDYLEARGFSGGETNHSDLIRSSTDHVILGEAKSIHENNESRQIRRGLGQLLEYRQRDIYQDEERSSRSITLCLILSQAPSNDYQNILQSVEEDGIFTYWIEDDEITGLDASLQRLSELVG